MPATTWFVHRFNAVGNYVFRVNHVGATMSTDPTYVKFPNEGEGYVSIEAAEAALALLGDTTTGHFIGRFGGTTA